MRRIFAQARKELTQILRDRLALILALVLPQILILLLGQALSLKVSGLEMAVQDLDGSPQSRRLIESFQGSVTFRLVPMPTTMQPEQALSDQLARVVLVIPPSYGRDIARGLDSPVQALIDGSDANTAKLISAYVGQVAAQSQTQAGVRRVPVNVESRFWYNPGGESRKFYGPGIFVLGISMFPPLLAALAMSKEGEQKTILQVYVSSISAHEFLLGKILAAMVIAIAESLIGFAVLFTVFGLRIAGDPTPLIVATILYAFCVASFGTLIGSAIPNQAAAIQAIAVGGFLLVFLLSGLIFAVENIPAGLRWISNIVWGRYYIEVVRDGLLQGGGWPAMWFRVFMIGLIGLVLYTVAWVSMRRMQLKD
jgi:ABC-2 type transport system permease protein